MYEYKGCYTTGWDRSKTSDVPITAKGVEDCQNYCNAAGFTYFGFECPHDNGREVHCECANSLTPSDQVDDQKCQEFNVNSGGHCSGPFVVETIFGTYYMGAGSLNSAYKVDSLSGNYNAVIRILYPYV